MNQSDLAHNPRLKIKTKLVQDTPDQLGRKKWKIQYQEADQQSPDNQTILNIDPRKQNYLIGRTQLINTKQKIGRKQQLDKSRKDGGFYCSLCKQLFKCDIAYITHLNSSMHNRKLGMSLKVQNINVDSVKNKLASKIQQNVDLKKQKKQVQFLKRVKKQEKQKLKVEQYRKQQQQALKKEQQENKEQEIVKQQGEITINESLLVLQTQEQKMMRQLGLPTCFGSKRRK